MTCNHLKGFLALAFAGVVVSACGSPGQASSTIKPEYDKATGRLTRLSHDSDNDGKIDTWAVMNGALVVRIEADEDANGSIDRWEHYATPPDGHAPDSASTIQKIERSTRRDGHVNRWEYFEYGTLSRVEEDSNFDGRLDKWEQYAGGSLSVMEIDTAGRGAPDRRLLYHADGTLDHIQTDADGSGHFEPVKP